jgi:AraC-like DNA-binding protein
MKTLAITSNALPVTFTQLQTKLGGKLISKAREYCLTCDDKNSAGSIYGFSIDESISYMEFDLEFLKNTTLHYGSDDGKSIHFAYCSEGEVMQSFCSHSKTDTIGQYQTGIFSNNLDFNTYFHFKKKHKVKISIISIQFNLVRDKDLKEQLFNSYFSNSSNSYFAYVGSHNLNIAEKIQQVKVLSKKGIIRNLFLNSQIYAILASEMEHHNKDESQLDNYFNSLTKNDLETIKETAQFIKNYPEQQYTLQYLSKKSGLPPIKLQKGFKTLYNRTVSDYIRNVRVEIAETLIRDTELNITEIVYSIGLTSRSYFSKIFKERYNCSPKNYKENSLMISVIN